MQEVIVALVVAWAGLAVLSRYTPRGLKRRMRGAFVRLAGRAGWKLAMPADDSSGGGCGTCSGCSGKSGPGAPMSQAVSVDALRRTARH